MKLLQRRLEQYFKNVPCFCIFDVYAIAKTAQIADICTTRVHKSIQNEVPCFKGSVKSIGTAVAMATYIIRIT